MSYSGYLLLEIEMEMENSAPLAEIRLTRTPGQVLVLVSFREG